MTDPQRYLIAKYAPDVRRMEPVNIGVVLWSGGRAVARFLPWEQAAGFVNDEGTYQRWMGYWHGLLAQSVIEPPGAGAVPQDDPHYLDAFAKTQQGNYLLVEGGQVTDRIPARQLSKAADYLFSQLVERPRGGRPEPRKEKKQLKAVCAKLFKDSGLTEREDFKPHYAVRCRVGHVDRDFTFSYAEANGRLKSVYQRVPLSVVHLVNSAAFMFDNLRRAGVLKKNRCAAIVQASGPNSDPETTALLEMLREFATVINVAEYAAAMEQLAAFTDTSA